MIRLCYSNRVEALVDALAENVALTRGSLFDAVRLVVPNALVGHTVKQGLARRLGIAAHIQDGFLHGFLRDVAQATTPGTRIVDRDLVEGELLALFHDSRRLASRDLHDVRVYLDAEGNPDGDRHAEGIDRRRVQLAGEIAALFDEYAFSRPEMLAAWQAGKLVPDLDEPLQRWQRALWLALFDRRHGELTKREAVSLPHFFANTPAEKLRVDPPVAHVFGLSYVARLYRTIFAAISQSCALHIYALNPCREFWEDLEPKRRKSPDPRFPKRRQKQQLSLFEPAMGSVGQSPTSPDAIGDPSSNENPLLRLWARPGRDNIRLLNQLSECDFDGRFEDPLAAAARPSLLARLQQGVLDREPFHAEHTPETADGSLVLWPCPSPRRELEAIAAEIWSLVREDEARERRGEPGRPLRFGDFAVIVPQAAAATYLPLAHAVFHEASDLPHTVFDLAPAADSGIGEAIELLLALPNSQLGRPDLLRLAMHPTVARRFPDVDPEDWLALCEELEIVQGADRSDHADSYLDRDRISWDQGLRRLALGAFLSGPRSGEDRPFDLGGERVLPGDVTAAAEPAARALGMLARELIDFARTARSAPAPLTELLALLRQTIAATISPATPQEQAALGDCFAVLERLTESAPKDLKVNFRVAADLVRTRLQLGSRGLARRAPEGVTVASFVPMRALPFRVIFVAGLDERVFPTSKGYTALDLRAAAREPGDVTPREQDEYMFLETLLSARERMYLSFVARDGVTGDPRGPSSTVVALTNVLGGDPNDPGATIRREVPPLWRHEDAATCAVIPAAARERAASALGRSLRQAAGGLIQLPPLGDLRPALAPETWAAIAPGLGGRDPIAATDLAARPKREPRRSLTFADLRRFLECPLQGAVRVLLPIRDDDDATDEAESALREHERLDEDRRDTVPFLRDLFCEAAAAGETSDAALARAYDRAAELARLDGTLADGLFGAAARARHQETLRWWRAGLDEGLVGVVPDGLAPLWFGAAPEHRRNVEIKPPLSLDLATPDGSLTIALGGRTEPVARGGDGYLTLTLVASSYINYPEKDFLGAWFTHLALAAAGVSAGPTRVLLIRPPRNGSKPSVQDINLAPISADEARAYLGGLAAEMLGGVHAYFFPYEAVFSWRAKKESRSVRDTILLLRDDGYTKFASDRGSVPEPRSYPVPDDATADAMVARRFGPFLDRLPRAARKGAPEPS